MSACVAIGTQNSYGYYITCTGGTGSIAGITIGTTGQPLVAANQSIRVVGIATGGANTADVCSVYDGQGNFVFTGAAATGAVNALQLGGAIRLVGLQVSFSGATTGYCIVYTPSGNG